MTPFTMRPVPRPSSALLGVAVFFVLATGGGPQQASAQSTARKPVTVMLVDSLPYSGADAVVVRRASSEHRDVILVRRNAASPRVFLAAAEVLRVSWTVSGSSSGEVQILRVPAQLTAREWNADEVRAAAGTLGRLRQASRPNVDITGLARGPAATVYLRSSRQ